jgi:hypothetical protein
VAALQRGEESICHVRASAWTHSARALVAAGVVNADSDIPRRRRGGVAGQNGLVLAGLHY